MLFQVNLGAAGTLLHNVTAPVGHWLKVNLVGTKSNRDGIGAVVEVEAGGVKQRAERVAGSGYLSQNDWRLHFGLGAATKADKITVLWPSGIRQVVENVPRQVVTIMERSGWGWGCQYRVRRGQGGGLDFRLPGRLAAAANAQNGYPSPDDMVLSPDGTRLYAVFSGSNEVAAIDTAERAVAGRVAVGKVPRGIATADGTRLYVTNSWADTVSEIDAATLRPLRTLPAGFEPTGIAFDGGALYVANRLSDNVTVVDVASGTSPAT